MFHQQSPLETLASYAISFTAGAVALAVVTLYGKWMQHRGPRRAPHNKEV